MTHAVTLSLFVIASMTTVTLELENLLALEVLKARGLFLGRPRACEPGPRSRGARSPKARH